MCAHSARHSFSPPVFRGGLAAGRGYLDSSIQSESNKLQRRLRSAGPRCASTPMRRIGHGAAAKRKQATPSRVMVLEAILRVLPTPTYVTELRIEGDKVQVVGMTQDAPSLIRLMEQSPQFTRATFFAAHTRAQERTGRTLPNRGAYHGLFGSRHMNAFAVIGKNHHHVAILAAAIYAGSSWCCVYGGDLDRGRCRQRDEVASASGC